MRATLTQICDLIRKLADLPEEIAAETLRQFEAEKGEPSEAMRAAFEIAAIYRKEKAAAATATISK